MKDEDLNSKKTECFYVNNPKLQKEAIIQELRKEGFRVTAQRRIILDIILNKECACCKEIFWEALKKDPSIGMSTVYRIINNLEEIGIINRKNLYKLSNDEVEILQKKAMLKLKNGENLKISNDEWRRIIEIGLLETRGIDINNVKYILVKKSDLCDEDNF